MSLNSSSAEIYPMSTAKTEHSPLIPNSSAYSNSDSLLISDGSSPVLNDLEINHKPASAPLLDKYGHIIVFNQAAITACIATLANTILGAGILGLPHAFASSGYGLGLFLLGLAACASGLGLHLLAQSAKKLGELPSSFYTVAKEALPRWTFLIDLAVAIKCFGPNNYSISLSYELRNFASLILTA
jgi:hypothetical protein